MTITLPFGWHLTDTAEHSNWFQFFSIWEITLWLRMIRWCDPSAVSWGGPADPRLPQCELLRLGGAGGQRLGLRTQVPHLCDEQKSATSFLTLPADEVLQSQSLHVRSSTNLPLTMLPQIKWHHSFRVSRIQLEGLSQAIMKVQLGQASPLWSSWAGSTYTLTRLLAGFSFCGLSAKVCLSSRQTQAALCSWLKGSVYSNVWNGIMMLTMPDIS